jgi:protein tyrosine phosphatase (PTP) superfamily phosphohydrolase (DUF442 family)
MTAHKYLAIFVPVMLLGCTRTADHHLEAGAIEKLDVEGLTNAYRLSDRIIEGGQPLGEAGFQELQKLGVKTIVSVTDKAPDVDAAEKFGLRYVHVPMDYEGVSTTQREQILHAVEDSSGPVYIHCDSGRNRGATAAAMCMIGVEGKSNEEALAWMKMRGVDEEKQKLYDAVREYKPGARDTR